MLKLHIPEIIINYNATLSRNLATNLQNASPITIGVNNNLDLVINKRCR